MRQERQEKSMSEYLLIESRDPFDSADVADFCELAESLSKAGHAVTVFLVQNGVLPARYGAKSGPLSLLAMNGVKVLADEFSLRERGISPNRLIPGVHAAPLDTVVDHLAGGCTALWH
jgi:sulfur relay (sulfurtransferase) complex TusBCD TusD component (DsrE family)